MNLELIYTSSPRGLNPLSSGYCTVACTRGMPRNYMEALESLGAYRQIAPSTGAGADALNPIVFSHYLFTIGGKKLHVISKIVPFGIDYTGRPNKLAHHIIVDDNALTPSGPAWLMSRPETFVSTWEGEPRLLDRPRKLPHGTERSGSAKKWGEIAGDAGWAGILAEKFLDHPEKPSYILFDPGMPMLDLLREAMALLPSEPRWDVGFNTYVNTIPNGSPCHWRCCLKDSPTLAEARMMRDTLIVDLTGARKAVAPDSPWADFARTGIPPRDFAKRSGQERTAMAQPQEAESLELQPVAERARSIAPPAIAANGARLPAKRVSFQRLTVAAAVLLLISLIANIAFLVREPRVVTINDSSCDHAEELERLKSEGEEKEKTIKELKHDKEELDADIGYERHYNEYLKDEIEGTKSDLGKLKDLNNNKLNNTEIVLANLQREHNELKARQPKTPPPVATPPKREAITISRIKAFDDIRPQLPLREQGVNTGNQIDKGSISFSARDDMISGNGSPNVIFQATTNTGEKKDYLKVFARKTDIVFEPVNSPTPTQIATIFETIKKGTITVEDTNSKIIVYVKKIGDLVVTLPSFSPTSSTYKVPVPVSEELKGAKTTWKCQNPQGANYSLQQDVEKNVVSINIKIPSLGEELSKAGGKALSNLKDLKDDEKDKMQETISRISSFLKDWEPKVRNALDEIRERIAKESSVDLYLDNEIIRTIKFTKEKK